MPRQSRALLAVAAGSLSALAWCQAASSDQSTSALQALHAIQVRASAGVTTTYRQINVITGEESLCRLYLKKDKFRVDQVITKLAHGATGTANVVSITTVDPTGQRSGRSGSARLSAKLTPEQALERLASPQPLRMVMTSGANVIAFSHVGWRYGWDSYEWMTKKFSQKPDLASSQHGSRFQLSASVNSDTTARIEIESNSQPRVSSRVGSPKSGSLNPLVELSLKETDPMNLVFRSVSDYSRIPEHLLQQAETPDHKIPRGREESEIRYHLLEEKFGPIDDSLFELNPAPNSLMSSQSSQEVTRLIDGEPMRLNEEGEPAKNLPDWGLALGMTLASTLLVVGGGFAIARRKSRE